MGNLIWHDWARLVTIAASVCTSQHRFLSDSTPLLTLHLFLLLTDAIWSGYWGIFYRKFFFDMAGGILRDPGGFQPLNSHMIFINMIVKAPILQLLTMITGVILLVLEIPPPFLKNTSIHRNFVIRIPILLLQTFTAILFYQVSMISLFGMACTNELCLGDECGVILVHRSARIHTSTHARRENGRSKGEPRRRRRCMSCVVEDPFDCLSPFPRSFLTTLSPSPGSHPPSKLGWLISTF
jgi:hypothetical protein